MVGGFGLQALLDSKSSIYVQDNTPNNERHYRASFYFDPNSLRMANGESFGLLRGAGPSTIFQLTLSLVSDAYRLTIWTIDDTNTWHTGELAISDSPNLIEIDWRAASSNGANDGYVILRVNASQQVIIPDLNNDTLDIDDIFLGAVAGIDKNTRGPIYFDAFLSTRETP